MLWYMAAIEFVTMALLQFLYASERVVVRFQCHDPRMDQGGYEVLVPPLSDVRSHVDQYGFVSFVIGCAFGSAPVFLAFCRSVKSIGPLMTLCTVGFHSTLTKSVYTTWLRRFLRYGREMQVGCLVQIGCTLLGRCIGSTYC